MAFNYIAGRVGLLPRRRAFVATVAQFVNAQWQAGGHGLETLAEAFQVQEELLRQVHIR